LQALRKSSNFASILKLSNCQITKYSAYENNETNRNECARSIVLPAITLGGGLSVASPVK
jgi:hypothetical protein